MFAEYSKHIVVFTKCIGGGGMGLKKREEKKTFCSSFVHENQTFH